MSDAGSDSGLTWYVFFATWIVLALASFYMFFLRRDTAFKRRYWAPWIVTIGVLFLVFMLLTGFPLSMVLVAVPFVALISFLNIRSVRFCDSCGATVHDWTLPWRRPRHCSRCGSPLA